MQDSVKPRAKVTVEIDPALVAAVGATDGELSSIIEQALEAYLRRRGLQPASEDDRASHTEYNRFIAEHGTLADSLRDPDTR